MYQGTKNFPKLLGSCLKYTGISQGKRTRGTSTRVRSDEKMETHQDSEGGDLPRSSVVKTLPLSAGGVGLTLGQ